MNPDQQKKLTFRSVISVLKIVMPVTFILTMLAIIGSIYEKHHVSESTVNDTESHTSPPVEDSVQLANGKTSQTDFEANYSAEAWYADYKANSVKFDDKYSNKKIDVYGKIKEIYSSLTGNSVIKLDTGDGSYESIVCDNVHNDKDYWKKEVEAVSVGDVVHIRGVFSDNELATDSFMLEHCHIINDNNIILR